jgi:hypothetical protein
MRAAGVFWLIKRNSKGVDRLYIGNFYIIEMTMIYRLSKMLI